MSAQPDFTFDDGEIEAELAEHDRRILVDHRPYGCGHLLIRNGSSSCYLLYTYVVRHRLPYCHIHYISDKAIFAKWEKLIRSSLVRRHKAKFVALDAQLVQDMKFPSSFNFWAPAHSLYKSSDVEPHQIDNLYSDVVFLKLTVLPNMSHELGKLARRFSPRLGRRSR